MFRLPLVALVLGAVTGPVCGQHDEPAFVRRFGHPLVFAHRGGAGLSPESTLLTFQSQYLRDPASIVEMDVRATKDGVLVVIHDDTVDRTTDGHGSVAQMTLDELQALDAAYCFSPATEHGTADPGDCRAWPPDRFPFRGTGHVVPTLAEVLASLPQEAVIGVEVKAPGIEKAVADLLRASRQLDKAIVGSETEEVAIRLRALLPELPHYLPAGAAKCVAIGAKLNVPYAGCPRYEVFASPLSASGLSLDTRAVIDRVHAQGVAIVYWTINDEREIERLLRLGADGVFTDFPDRARAVADRLIRQGLYK